MGVLLSHIDLAPLFYGIVIFLGILSLYIKLTGGMIMSFVIELTVFILVFRLHGGTMAGGFAATVAALLAGFIFPLISKFR